MQKNVPEIKWLNVLLEKEVKKYFRSEKEEIEQSELTELFRARDASCPKGKKMEQRKSLTTRDLIKECDYMGKAILAAIVTLIVGYLGMVVGLEFLGNWVEFGLLIAIAVMGAFIIYFNDKKK